MDRRNFVKSTAVSALAAAGAIAKGGQLPRRTYKGGDKLSIIGFGGILVMGQEQKDANALVAEAVQRGVNYFDVAPSYGDGEAETKLGPALEPFRKNAFLACKTTMRDALGAARELERSLTRLRTDHFDLYQFHAVGKMEDVDRILAPGGAAETFVKARKDGKVRHIGFSAHNAEAAIRLMNAIELDSVLFPINYVNYAEGHFGPQILAEAKKHGMARMALKALAQTTWKPGETRTYPNCWYRPIEDPDLQRQALRFTLSEEITAAITPGYPKFLRAAIDIAIAFKPMKESERTALLASARGTEPIFKA
jgi:predicted aldo/keto reductase-like oxidoreductase